MTFAESIFRSPAREARITLSQNRSIKQSDFTMQSKAATVDAYLQSLPDDRRDALNAIRKVFKANLDEGFEEGMNYGMIGYYVPHSIYPAGYHCDPKQPLPFAGIASQKNAISIYLFCIYCDEAHAVRFVSEWKRTGKKLDMGKSCIRAKTLDGFALDVIGETIKRMTLKSFIEIYERTLKQNAKASAERSAARQSAKPAKKATKTPAKKSAKKAPRKKSPSNKKS